MIAETMANLWFTSDWHIGHSNIIKHANRPFGDVEEMNATILQRYRALVAPEDTVWFLGDIAWKPVYLDLLADLPGHKILVRGNHDRATDTAMRQRAGFENIYDGAMMDLFGVKCRLSHYPYAGYSSDPRYLERRPERVPGEVLIHGHSHVPPEKRINAAFRSVNIGVDAWDFFPVSVREVVECIDAITGT